MSCLSASISKILEHFGEKMRKFLPAEPFFCMSHVKNLLKCPYSKKPAALRKIPVDVPINLIVTFHPNCHTDVTSGFFQIWPFTESKIMAI